MASSKRSLDNVESPSHKLLKGCSPPVEVDVVPLAFQLLYQVRSSAKWDEFRFTERASSEFKALQGFEYEQIVGILQKFIDTLPEKDAEQDLCRSAASSVDTAPIVANDGHDVVAADPQLPYRLMAVMLRETSRFKQTEQLLRDFYYKEWVNTGRDDLAPRRFFVIVAPSGAGKTQMAFNLENTWNVLHVALCLASLSLSAAGDTLQPVYQCSRIRESTLLLCEALERDADHCDKHVTDLLPLNVVLETVALHSKTFGLYNSQQVPISAVADFRKALWEFAAADASVKGHNCRLPVVVVDEAICSTDAGSLRRLFFLRRILTACGVASVFMGQDLRILNPHVTPIKFSGRIGFQPPAPWATLLCSLPCTRLTAEETNFFDSSNNPTGGSSDHGPAPLLLEVAQFFGYLRLACDVNAKERARSVNPLFAHMLWQALIEHPQETLDGLRSAVARALYQRNETLRRYNGLHGQLLYLIGARPTPSDMVFVRDHYAYFPAEYRLVIQNEVMDNEDPASCKLDHAPVFSTLSEDPVMPLLFGGCCHSPVHPPPFALRDASQGEAAVREVPLTATAAVLLVTVSDQILSTATEIPLSCALRCVTCDSGMYVVQERITTVAVLCAAQSGGVHGTPAGQFLLQLATELLAVVPEHPLRWGADSGPERWWQRGGKVIPFTPAISQEGYPADALPNAGWYEHCAFDFYYDDYYDESWSFGVGKDASGSALFFTAARSRHAEVDEDTMPVALKRFADSGADLGIMIMPAFPANADMAVASAATDLNVVKVYPDGETGTVTLLPFHYTSAAAENPTRRLLCVFECDEERLMPQIYHRFGSAISAFLNTRSFY